MACWLLNFTDAPEGRYRLRPESNVMKWAGRGLFYSRNLPPDSGSISTQELYVWTFFLANHSQPPRIRVDIPRFQKVHVGIGGLTYQAVTLMLLKYLVRVTPLYQVPRRVHWKCTNSCVVCIMQERLVKLGAKLTSSIICIINLWKNTKKFLQVVKEFCVLEHIIMRVKSDAFFRWFFFDAPFFKSIIDLGISMPGHLFLCRIFWILVLPTRGYRWRWELQETWPKHIVPT